MHLFSSYLSCSVALFYSLFTTGMHQPVESTFKAYMHAHTKNTQACTCTKAHIHMHRHIHTHTNTIQDLNNKINIVSLLIHVLTHILLFESGTEKHNQYVAKCTHKEVTLDLKPIIFCILVPVKTPATFICIIIQTQ